MLLLISLILPVFFNNDSVLARTDDLRKILVELIVGGTPILFPPARISAHLCIDREEQIRLSREMSENGILHEIRNTFEESDAMRHDELEHLNLYVLDLDCDYAPDALRLANSNKMFVAPAKWLILQDRRGNRTNFSSPELDDTFEIFEDLAVYPDSDVVLARRIEEDFFELISVYRPSPYRSLIVEDRGNFTKVDGLRMRTYDVASRRRRNLRLTPLKSCLVMTNPETINHLTDYKDKHIDAVTKAGYVWVHHLVNRMNATVNFSIASTWGYQDENGSWSGMVGMLQRREIDIGGTATFFIPQRIGVVEYIQLYTRTGSRFVFRQPLLSTVSNIFTLPFQSSVWLAIGVLLLLVFCLLYLSTKWEYYRSASPNTEDYWKQMNPAEQTLSDNFLVILGAIAQQGYSYEPYRVPSRIVTLMLLIAALSLYASYTANIVALLQSTTNAINTPADLLKSPLKLGVQDVVYNRYYFKAVEDPIRKAILKQKIESDGHKSSWMSIQEGVHRVRNSPFAFHGEIGIIYKIMQETYQEEEKCGITEIDFLNVLYPLFVIQKQSPYLEIVKNGALLLRESGLKFRDEYRLFTKKPKCNGQTGFITIGFTECYFALVTMGYGILLTFVVFILELIWHKRQKGKFRKDVKNTPAINYVD